MPAELVCSECGAKLSPDAQGGLCVRCLFTLGLKTEPASPPQSEIGIRTSPIENPKIRYFGDYELQEELGRGGMGVVFKARQVSLQRSVAVKLILAGELASEAEVKRFLAEAAAVAKFDHPNIVAIHEVGNHKGQHYFSMDYVRGESLAAMIRDQPLAPETAARHVRIIAEAIHYAHKQGILHRDLKPSNVLIDGTDAPRITDFGLAKRLDGGTDLTLTGQVLGTPGYVPPEQAAGKQGEVGSHSDVYSLGAILYALLTGRPPFLANTREETLVHVLNREPVSPRVLNPSVDKDLETICLKCLEKNPGRRYGSACAMAEDLERWLSGRPILARPVSIFGKLWRWCRRDPIRASLAGSILLLLLILALSLPWRAGPAGERKLLDLRGVIQMFLLLLLISAWRPTGLKVLAMKSELRGIKQLELGEKELLRDMLPPSAGPPPGWFPDFLRYMALMRLNSDGELEPIKTADWLALRERLRGVLRASESADTPHLRILRKYVRE